MDSKPTRESIWNLKVRIDNYSVVLLLGGDSRALWGGLILGEGGMWDMNGLMKFLGW